MGTKDALESKEIVQTHNKILSWPIHAFFPLIFLLFGFYIFVLSSYSRSYYQPSSKDSPINTSFSPPQKAKLDDKEHVCDYTNGNWLRDKVGPLYNETSCATIKEGRNCRTHGRSDVEYLYWRWVPKECELPRFDPETFLGILKNKHLAFVGDSLARNQLESLLCMLAMISTPELVYSLGEDDQFRRWYFQAHNANVSIYWSPFLVKGVEKNNERNYNVQHLESVDERWASDIGHIDILVLSIGQWFMLPAVFYYKEKALGCHICVGQNYTEIGFYNALGMAYKTAFESIFDKKEGSIDVIVTTFPPAHFEGEWDKFGACSRTLPYKPEEKVLQGIDDEMRRIATSEVEEARKNTKEFARRIRIEALDITKLSLLRPDAHPGPYMLPNPFVNRQKDRVPNDCVHWCLPGAIDTWNQIMLEVMKRWK